MTKDCFKCGDALPLSEFYRHKKMADGHLNKCKRCCRSDAAKHREENLDRVRQYDRVRGSLPHRVKGRKEYQKTAAGRVVVNRGKSAWIARNPEKRAAHLEVQKALKRGDLVKQPCLVCGTEKSQAHHGDYSRPLDVSWLCPRHHREAHSRGTP